VAVRLFYWTAWVSNGQVNFRDDIYGWDEATAKLADGVVQPPARVSVANAEPAPGASTPAEQTMETNDYVPAKHFGDYAIAADDSSDANNEADQPSEPAPPPVSPPPQ